MLRSTIYALGILKFVIPGFIADTIEAEALLAEYSNDDNFTWSGAIDDYGDVILTAENGAYVGYVQIRNTAYSLHPIYGNKCVVLKTNAENAPLAECATGVAETGSAGWPCTPDVNCSKTIDILLLVSEEANDWLNVNMGFWKTTYLKHGVQFMNHALASSGVLDRKVKASILYNVVFPPYPILPPGTVPNIIVDEGNFFVLNTAFVSEVNSLRNLYGADLVIYLTNRGYHEFGNPTFPPVFGIAQDIPDFPYSGTYKAIVEVPYLWQPNFTLTHEASHLFGCNHELIKPHDCPNAHVFSDGSNSYKTIVASGGASGSRILRYSNPAVSYNGVPTGIESATQNANNARAIRNAACAIADYKTGTNIAVHIAGSHVMCENGGSNATFTANISPASLNQPVQPPYSYAWEIDNDPLFNPGQPVGANPSITFNTPPFCPKFYVRLKVTGSDGASAYSAPFVVFTSYCEDCYNLHDRTVPTISETMSTVLFPNPASSVLFVNSGVRVKSLEIFNSVGKRQWESTNLDRNKDGQIEIPLLAITNGFYFLKITKETDSEWHSFIISH